VRSHALHGMLSLVASICLGSSGGRFIHLLVNGWSFSECGCVADGSLFPFVVLVEGT
jgi:hypothetical protein